MYAVELDQSKHLLVISASQRITAEQAKLAAERVREVLQDIAPGFRVLADFRWLDSMDSAAAPHIAEIMDTLAEKGVASVTRVMPDPHKDIGLNILSQFHYGPEIQIATFQTLADALQSMAGADSPST
jgi:anti-anti-sigma regulatory factor